jgi:hypothetical protein
VSEEWPTLREAVNVPEALERDRLVRRRLRGRAEVAQCKVDVEHWNRTHPNETPLDTTFEDAMIAWYDGRGPMPELPPWKP